MTDSRILLIARAAIAELGEHAEETMQARAEAHRNEGEVEGAEFWAQVAAAVRTLQRATN